MYLRLEPVSWIQEIRDYPSIKVEGLFLRVNCKPQPDSNLRLSNNTKLTDLTIDLGIVAREQPVDAQGKPLKDAIGDFRFHDDMPPREDIPGMDAFLSAFLQLKPTSFTAVWEQVRDGGYVGCDITIDIDPVKSEGLGWVWDISQPLVISAASINFRRELSFRQAAIQAAPRKSFFEWLRPSAAADAELNAAVAEALNRDVEKRQRNAWLRKISFIGRIFVYACLFGALFIFRPEGLSDVTSKPLAQLSVGDILAAVLWVVIALVLLNAFFRPNPRPDFQEAWGLFGLVLSIGALLLGALFLYLRA